MSRGPREHISKTIPANSRVGALDLAALCLFYRDRGVQIRSLSEVVRTAIRDFADVLERNGHAKRPASLEDALAVLDGFKEDGIYPTLSVLKELSVDTPDDDVSEAFNID